MGTPSSRVVIGLAISLKMKHIGSCWVVIILLLLLLPYRQTIGAGTDFIATEILADILQVFFY